MTARAPSTTDTSSARGPRVEAEPLEEDPTLKMTCTLVLDDPVLATLQDSSPPDVLATWRSEAMSPADAASALPPSGHQRPTQSSWPPAPAAWASRDVSVSTPTPNGTMSPDGTLLPWRYEPAPPPRRGWLALAMAFALIAGGLATIGLARAAPVTAVSPRIARTAEHGVRDLEMTDSATSKAELPPPSPAPVSARATRRRKKPPVVPAAGGGDVAEQSAGAMAE